MIEDIEYELAYWDSRRYEEKLNVDGRKAGNKGQENGD